MGDRKPPQTVGDERAAVLDLLQFQRESFLRKVEGLSEEDARRTLVGSGTTLLWLTKHVAFAETIWVLHRFAQLPDVVLDNEVHDTDTVTDAIAAYREVWAGVDSVVAATPDLATMCADTQFAVDLRWILLHLLEEIARHAGHADILRELIDGSTGR